MGSQMTTQISNRFSSLTFQLTTYRKVICQLCSDCNRDCMSVNQLKVKHNLSRHSLSISLSLSLSHTHTHTHPHTPPHTQTKHCVGCMTSLRVVCCSPHIPVRTHLSTTHMKACRVKPGHLPPSGLMVILHTVLTCT